MRTECQAAGCSSLLWRARPAVLTSLLPRGVGGGRGGGVGQVFIFGADRLHLGRHTPVSLGLGQGPPAQGC